MRREDIEIMAPVGSFESLAAAIQAKADAIYFGIGRLNMRSNSAANFSIDNLKEIANVCKDNGMKSYLTLNTVIYDEDMEQMQAAVDAAKDSGISAVIASDWAVIDYARQNDVTVHCSTQLNISNTVALERYAKYAEVAVLARELNIQQVKYIYDYIQAHNITTPSGRLMRIEMFIHGALCMAISGKCYLSLHEHNKSANRGACLQPCRRTYTAREKEFGYELDIDNQYIMSPKDLCTIGFLDRLLDAGARVLKIEGRGRSPEYVKRVTECYNEAVDAIISGTYSAVLADRLAERLKEVFNRGFWDGYYLGRTLGEWTERHSSSATKRKEYVGVATNYYSKLGVGEFMLHSGKIFRGDEILIVGPTTGVIETAVTDIHGQNGDVIKSAAPKLPFSIPVPEKIRRNDKLYKLSPVER